MTENCTHTEDVAAWTLSALEEREAAEFAAHLETCDSCQAEVEALLPAAEVLGMAAPQVAPPHALRDRIMSVARAEAQLLNAAGPELDRAPVKPKRKRDRRLSFGPAFAGSMACALLALGITAGFVIEHRDSGSSTKTYEAAAEGMTALATVDSDRVTLHLDGMKPPPDGRIYQVWFLKDGTPVPTNARFVPKNGKATIAVDKDLGDTQHVVITDEKPGGAREPTGDLAVDAKIS